MHLGYWHGIQTIYPSGNGGRRYVVLTYNYYKTVK